MGSVPPNKNLTSGQSRWLARLWAFALIVLTTVSHPLWITLPGSVSAFPRIHFIPDAFVPPSIVSHVLYLGLLCICLALLLSGNQRFHRQLWMATAALLLPLVLLDQHRLQPWVFQAILVAMTLACCRWTNARRLIEWIAISVYVYSSLGKMDFQFVHTVGRELVQAMTAPIIELSDETATKAAFLLPASEFAIAILLTIKKTRRLAGYGLIALHLSLIAVLGPWNLGHSNGVLAWNLVLAIQAWLLFVQHSSVESHNDSSTNTDNQSTSHTPYKTRWIAYAVCGIALIAPATERSGYWDHWTSWALYSPHSSRATIQIHESAFEKLPETALPFFNKDADGDGWAELDLARWSLNERLVPIYPQARYQIAVALKLAQTYDIGKAIRVQRKDVSDRWTGKRKETFLIGEKDLEKEMQSFWLHFNRQN